MFKRLRTFILAGLGTIAICCGAGFSYWFFAETSYRYIKSGAEVEDIYENYNSGKPNPITQYEMYVFPSTWYLSQYKTKAEDPTGNDVTIDKPELKYGYIERSLNSNNEVVDIYVDPDGERYNEANISWTEKYCYDIDSYETEEATDPSDIKTFKHPKDDGKEPLFNESTPSQKLGELYITYRLGSIRIKNKYKCPTNNKGEKIGFNDYGNPDEDTNDYKGYKNDESYQETEDPNYGGIEGKPIYQKLNIDDRLGYWYELDASHGRFLPIKISFSGSLSPQTFQKLIPNPRADMADSNAYHNYAFCNWVYYNPYLDGNNKPYVEPADGFSNYDRINIFDALLNLENISYENKETGKREIRLFPVFSNGKDYPGRITDVSGEYDDNALGQGYRDGLKVEYITEDSNGSTDMRSRYFTFHKGIEHQNVNHNGTNYNYAKLNNFNTNGKMLKYINFAGVYTHSFYNKGYFGNHYYEKCSYGDWVNFNAKANISNLQDGDKNIYAISTTEYYGKSDAIEAMQSLVKEMHNGLGPDVNSYKGLFGSLKDRELSAIYDNFTDKSNILVVSDNENNKEATQYRAYALFFERILDLKAIAGFPVNDNYITDEDYDIYKETSPGALLDFYESEYDNSRNLFTENSTFYVGTKGNGNTFIPESNSPTSVNEKNKFIYKIDSLDLSKEPLKFFNIRIEKYDSSLTKNIKFNLYPLGEQNVDKVLYEGELNANGNGTINGDGSNTFVNGSEYFELIKYRYSSKDDPPMSKDTIGFKLKQNGTSSGLGYYDIVLVFDSDSSTPAFNVYAYKHKNIFVKIFDQELTTYKDGETQGFINHNPTDVKYYERIYDYNEVISKENEFTPMLNGVIAGDKKIIDDVIIEFATIRHNSSANAGDGTYKDFTGKRSDGTMDTEETYFIVDHVTKSILCKATFDDVNKQFVVIVNQTIDLSVIKNYVLYVITQTQYRSNKYNPLEPYNKPVTQ